MKHLFWLASLFICVAFGGCKPDGPANPEESFAQERENIIEYLANKGLTAEEDASGLFYIIEEEGDGKRPNLNSTVKVHYHGTLLDGTVFDSSVQRGQPAEFPLAGVVMGWQLGIPLFKEGGKGTLILPSKIAYGARQAGLIQPFSTLVFEVELLEVN